MTETIRSYLFFSGNCEAAMVFYQTALSAEVLMTMRFRDSPEPLPPGMVPEGYDDKIMHATLRVGESILLASDGADPEESFASFRLALTCQDQAEAERRFAALAEGGRVDMPLGPTFWSPCYGMVTDPFGVGWMVSVDSPPN